MNYWEWPAEQEDQDRWLKDRLDFAEKNEEKHDSAVGYSGYDMGWHKNWLPTDLLPRLLNQNAMAKECEALSLLKFTSWVNMPNRILIICNISSKSNKQHDDRCAL